jgi:hypothetical protein
MLTHSPVKSPGGYSPMGNNFLRDPEFRRNLHITGEAM